MKRKILLLTTIYPAPDLKYGTSAIHYFTREWVKMGHDVIVIHYQTIYPSFFYFFAKLFRDRIASKTGAIVFTQKQKNKKEYILDDVTVYRIPIFKKIPHGKYSDKVIVQQVNEIKNIIEINNFTPDIIIGHFANPQLKIISCLKRMYNARTCLVMHNVGNHVDDGIKKIFKKDYTELMNDIDIWGYRSLPIKNGFERNFGKQKESFLCFSGIPEDYICKDSNRFFESKLRKFVYVGELIERKCPLSLIDAIVKVYPNKDFHIVYVGEGSEKSTLLPIINSQGLQNNISFLGRMPRNEIVQILDGSDCLIMISKNETFGLVYLEAMARGCITIGSRNEGIDGVIVHGVNGFLCEAGNSDELAMIIEHIDSLTSNERKTISENAITTAKELTDFKAADKYITSIVDSCC